MKKKSPGDTIQRRIMEINCPNCGMISYIGSIESGETKEFHCEAGEASCGRIWTEKFDFENIHDYDIESLHNNNCEAATYHGKFSKTNWGGKDKDVVIERARDIEKTFSDPENRKKEGHLAYVTDGIRVVDREDNILFEWIR